MTTGRQPEYVPRKLAIRNLQQRTTHVSPYYASTARAFLFDCVVRRTAMMQCTREHCLCTTRFTKRYIRTMRVWHSVLRERDNTECRTGCLVPTAKRTLYPYITLTPGTSRYCSCFTVANLFFSRPFRFISTQVLSFTLVYTLPALHQLFYRTTR